MKSLKYLIFSIIVVSLCSCSMLNYRDMNPAGRNYNLLPALDVVVDVRSFDEFYNGVTLYDIYQTENTKIVSKPQLQSQDALYDGIIDISEYTAPTPYVESFTSSSVRVKDLVTFFDKDVRENMMDPSGYKRGSIHCRLVNGRTRSPLILPILSILSFGVLNVYAVPFSSFYTSLEIQVDIYDLNNRLVGSYIGGGDSKVFTALYYGYFISDASRKSAIDAFREAMTNIKMQINGDAYRLDAALQ